MKIEIRVGNVNVTSPRVQFDCFNRLDDIDLETKRMYDFLLSCNDCIIENVDEFLLYTVNNGLMAFHVKDNPDIQKNDDDDDYFKIPQFDKEKFKIIQIYQNGVEECIQRDDTGTTGKNYHNLLMGRVMDDYYDSLNYYE